jgi:FkbM family methyltransferase
MTHPEYTAIQQVMRTLRSPCIVELGAHTGEDEATLRAACNESVHYIMVEPDPRNCQHILDREPTSRTRRLIIAAVTDKDRAWAPFHFSDNIKTGDHGSGSVRTPTGHLEMDWIKFRQAGAVQTRTLDSIFESEWLTKIDLLWVDIQGAENLMIAGGQAALRHTRYLFMEIEKVELYAGEALRDELYAMLPGWELLQEFEQNALLWNTAFVERGPR